MLGSPILEVVIGLVFIFLLFSLLSTVINELIASFTSLRASNLKEAIRRMLDDEEIKLSEDFYRHPLIKYMGRRDKSIPSYIEPATFAKVVSDILKTGRKVDEIGKKAKKELEAVSDKIEDLGLNSETTELLKSFARDVNDNWEKFDVKLESWFNETMDRAKGWYVRKLKVVSFLVGFAIAASFNVDTLQIYNKLSQNADMREELVNAATAYLEKAKTSQDTVQTSLSRRLGNVLNDEINPTTNLMGIGWYDGETGCDSLTFQCVLLKFVGWVITALAISLGAPFWFDLLNKLVKLRGTGDNPEKKEKNK